MVIARDATIGRFRMWLEVFVKVSVLGSGLLVSGWLAALPVFVAAQAAPDHSPAAATGQATVAEVTPVPAPAAAAAHQPDVAQLRFQISVMEGVLERAVAQGARSVTQRVQAIMPDALLWGGTARARGFRLEPYGVFFDVEVPALRRSIAWSFRTLDQNDLGVTDALQSLRQFVKTVSDQRERQQLEQAVKRLELIAGPGAAANPRVRGASTLSTQDRELLEDPGAVYTSEVKRALIDAMLDYGTNVPLAPDEWLTIAARDNEDRRLSPADPGDVATIILRMKGSELAAVRERRIDREAARKQVEVKEF